MTYLAHYEDRCAKKLILGPAYHLAPMYCLESKLRCGASSEPPIKCLGSHEGSRIRNSPKCPQLGVDKWGNTL